MFLPKKWVLAATVWGFRNVKHKNKQAFIVEKNFFLLLLTTILSGFNLTSIQGLIKNALNLSLMYKMCGFTFNVCNFCEFYLFSLKSDGRVLAVKMRIFFSKRKWRRRLVVHILYVLMMMTIKMFFECFMMQFSIKCAMILFLLNVRWNWMEREFFNAMSWNFLCDGLIFIRAIENFLNAKKIHFNFNFIKQIKHFFHERFLSEQA